jgi:lysozyme
MPEEHNTTNAEASPAPPQASRSSRFRDFGLGLAGLISSIVIPVLGFTYASRDKEREVSKGFVEIATKILESKPTEENKPLREWAVALINNYSDVKLPEATKRALISAEPIFTVPAGPGAISRSMLQQILDDGHLLGVDMASFHAREADFPALKQRGVQFVYIKATQGANSTDVKAADFAARARQSGLKVGLYHFFTGADAAAQLANFSSRLSDIPWDLPPVIDCEEEPLSKAVPTDYVSRVESLATGLQERFGVKPIIYTGRNFADAHLDERLSKYPLFVASYNQTKPRLPKWWTGYVLWQVGNQVSDDPVLSKLDVVAFKGSPADLAALSAGKK